jgi:hypothetical protein
MSCTSSDSRDGDSAPPPCFAHRERIKAPLQQIPVGDAEAATARKSILWIDDWIEGFPVRRLGLWKRSTVAAACQAVSGG